MKKVFVVMVWFLIVMAVIIGSLAYIASTKPAPVTPSLNVTIPTTYTLYVGNGCPHCEIVESYMANNSIETKLHITLKEVWYNKTNNVELGEVAKKCNLGSKVGIPLLYADNQCYVGDKYIIAFFDKVNK
jgi:glutaredoxin